MSGHPAVASSAPAGRLVTLSGWGGRPRSTARVVRPAGIEGIEQLPSSEPIVPRGLGRSYGDAAQLAGGTVLDLTGMADIDLDVAGGRVTTGGGASLAEVIDTVLPHGWFLPVTPGTRHVTVGGAVAADIHGKNHHRDGSFGDHLESLRILTGDGREVVARPGDPDFRATLGGMGLTGVIVEASFRLVDVASSWMRVDTYRADDLGGVMDRLQEADRRYRYSVAWLDLAPGRRGRGVIMGGDHATPDELPARSRRRPLHRKAGPALPAPRLPAGGRLVGSSVGVFNALWYRKSREGTARPTRIDEFFYPLDRLDEWHRLYGGGGFLQYQFV
ncbi:MAG: FAD-dependent oxidoreductase, partial [Actinomycetota bacterium]